MEIGKEKGPGSAPKTDPPGGYYKPPAGGVKRLLSFPGFIILHRFAEPVALAIHLEDPAVMRYGASRLRREELMADEKDWKLRRWWDVVLVGFVPLGAIILLIWWLVKEAESGKWYNPLDPASVMNCLVQWFVVLSVLLLIGRWLGRRVLAKSQ